MSGLTKEDRLRRFSEKLHGVSLRMPKRIQVKDDPDVTSMSLLEDYIRKGMRREDSFINVRHEIFNLNAIGFVSFEVGTWRIIPDKKKIQDYFDREALKRKFCRAISDVDQGCDLDTVQNNLVRDLGYKVELS